MIADSFRVIVPMGLPEDEHRYEASYKIDDKLLLFMEYPPNKQMDDSTILLTSSSCSSSSSERDDWELSPQHDQQEQSRSQPQHVQCDVSDVPAVSKRNVSFAPIVRVRYHPLLLGDNPFCSHGPPVTLAWKSSHEEKWELSSHDNNHCPAIVQRRSRREREELLLQAGYTARAVREMTLQIALERDEWARQMWRWKCGQQARRWLAAAVTGNLFPSCRGGVPTAIDQSNHDHHKLMMSGSNQQRAIVSTKKQVRC